MTLALIILSVIIVLAAVLTYLYRQQIKDLHAQQQAKREKERQEREAERARLEQERLQREVESETTACTRHCCRKLHRLYSGGKRVGAWRAVAWRTDCRGIWAGARCIA